MINTTPLYISPKGGSIVCFSLENKRVFQACSSRRCFYSSDLYSAKKQLEKLELPLTLDCRKNYKFSAQRKTTLKWNSDGELSAVDKARILDLLAPADLTQCSLTCEIL